MEKLISSQSKKEIENYTFVEVIGNEKGLFSRNNDYKLLLEKYNVFVSGVQYAFLSLVVFTSHL